MRVVHFIDTLRRGGAERVALLLASGMLDRGWEPLVISVRADDEYPEYPQVARSFLVPTDARRGALALPTVARNLRRELARQRPDVVEIHSPFAEFAFAASLFRAPVVRVLHGHVDVSWEHDAGGLRRTLLPKAQRWLARRTIGHIAISSWIADAARDRLGLRGSRLVVVPNGVELLRFNFVQRDVSSAPVVAVLGRLVDPKRPQLALRAFQQLVKAWPGATLWFIGDGPLRPGLEREAGDRGLASSVNFLGLRSDVPQLLSRAHLLWHFCKVEGLGLAVLEAMATGLPVVASDGPGCRESIENGVTGWLVPAEDIEQVGVVSGQILRDQGLYRRLALEGRRRVETHFSHAGMVEGHMRALDQWRREHRPANQN